MSKITGKISKNPIIAAVRKVEDLELAVTSPVTTVFLLHADIFNIKAMVDRVKDSQKNVLIHIDFLEGLGRDHKAIDYIAEIIRPDGIISTNSNYVKYAREKGIFTIQRFFLVDSLSYDTTIKAAKSIRPDMVEIMPAVKPRIISRICRQLPHPVIVGGLIEEREDIIEVLKAGTLAVSVGKKELWNLEL